MYMREPKVEVALSKSGTIGVALGLTTLAVLAIGVYPKFLVELARAALAGF
jgi:hypothetical protein